MNEQYAVRDEDLEDVIIKADAVIKSIGYKTLPIAGVPFDSKKNTIPHNFGCVTKDGSPQIGLYVCGWAKRGPVGIIDATLRDSKETFGMIKHHIENGQLPEMKTTIADVERILP
jgi:adrenodoxin-NADP+ reductase